jgi:predicted phosphodiesterase
VRRLRIALTIALVALAALGGELAVLASFYEQRRLSIATVRMSVHPGTRGALALYVPLVDWGVRFHAVRLPAELRLDVRSIDRAAASRIARNQRVDVAQVRADARDATAAYLRTLLAMMLAGGLLAGSFVALAVRHGNGPRVRWLLLSAALATVGGVAVVALTLPPRGPLDDPQYFAHGADIPRALQAVEQVGRSQRNLSEELDAQLVGLARLVLAPGERTPAAGARRLVLASDLHNNVLVLPALARAAQGLPLFMAGDLTDRGSALETAVTARVAAAGHPLVFVSGNHDSDTLELALARAGAIVLTRRGRLLPDGRHGPRVVHVAGLRVAGYDDPFMRRRNRPYHAFGTVSAEQQRAFDRWLRRLGPLDVAMVHEPALAALALRRLTRDPPAQPLVLLVGHTHVAALDVRHDVVELNAGTAGGGGSGNLTEHQDIGLATLGYRASRDFLPLAADLVTIAPGSGAATARHEPLDLSR